MMILDANILLYAYNADAPQQVAAARWLAELVQSDETIALPWVTIWAFLRIATNHRIWSNPLSSGQVFDIINAWLAQPGLILLQPGQRHAEILQRLVTAHGASGPLVTDAVLASLAIENGASLASTDQHFRRFPDLQWINPLAG